jgi:hypothetical protein
VPFVTFERPVRNEEQDAELDKMKCIMKVMADRIMLVNRTNTEMRKVREKSPQKAPSVDH